MNGYGRMVIGRSSSESATRIVGLALGSGDADAGDEAEGVPRFETTTTTATSSDAAATAYGARSRDDRRSFVDTRGR